jgi:hypothetical protein
MTASELARDFPCFAPFDVTLEDEQRRLKHEFFSSDFIFAPHACAHRHGNSQTKYPNLRGLISRDDFELAQVRHLPPAK